MESDLPPIFWHPQLESEPYNLADELRELFKEPIDWHEDEPRTGTNKLGNLHAI